MRIISGTAANLEIITTGDLTIRPTLARVRKALFDSLGNIEGACVLDLFSGSGALALEASSRGARHADLVEFDKNHVAIIEENIRRIKKTGVQCHFEIHNTDVLNTKNYLPERTPNLVFADPPYDVSGRYFARLISDELFLKRLHGTRLIWEVSDAPGELGKLLLSSHQLRTELRVYCGTRFLFVSL